MIKCSSAKQVCGHENPLCLLLSIINFKMQSINQLSIINSKWIILLNLVYAGYLQFLAISYNLAANEYGFLL